MYTQNKTRYSSGFLWYLADRGRVISTIFSLLDTFFNVIKSALYRHFRRKAFLNVHNENIDIRKKRVRIVYRNNRKDRLHRGDVGGL